MWYGGISAEQCLRSEHLIKCFDPGKGISSCALTHCRRASINFFDILLLIAERNNGS
jgi:hypothetical protein